MSAPGLRKLALSRRAWPWLALIWGVAVGSQAAFGQSARDLVSVPLALVLAWLALIDLDRMQLPDLLTLPLIGAGLAYCFWSASGIGWHGLIGAGAGYLALAGLGRVFRQLRGLEGIGLGDAKLLAGAGAWLGWAALPSLVLVASGAGLLGVLAVRLAGSPRARASRAIAFGPYLCTGFWCVWLFGTFQALPY